MYFNFNPKNPYLHFVVEAEEEEGVGDEPRPRLLPIEPHDQQRGLGSQQRFHHEIRPVTLPHEILYHVTHHEIHPVTLHHEILHRHHPVIP
jgi:hypothetical protein